MPSSRLPIGDIVQSIKDINNSKSRVTIVPDKQSFAATSHRLKPYKSLPNIFRPTLEKIADYVRIEMIPRTFQQEGPGWRPLSRRAVAERELAGYGGQHPILKRSGDLFKELTQRSHPKHVEIIKVGKHARIEIGGTSAKFIENQMGMKEKRLPARPMIPGTGNIPLPQRDRMAIKSIVIKSIQQRHKVI